MGRQAQTHREDQAARAESRTALVRYLEDKQGNLTQWAQDANRARQLLRTAVFLASKEESLMRCKPVSIFTSLVAFCQMGLDLNPVRGSAYLVPFGDVATPIPGYKGLVNLAQRSGIHPLAALVYTGDRFEVTKGTDERVTHVPNIFAQDRGSLLGGYAVARVCGSTEVLIMRLDQLEAVRRQARRGTKETPAWRDHTEAMYLKTLLRRISKTLPLDDGAVLAQHVDGALSARRFQGLPRGHHDRPCLRSRRVAERRARRDGRNHRRGGGPRDRR
jgi:recombination protein RecT